MSKLHLATGALAAVLVLGTGGIAVGHTTSFPSDVTIELVTGAQDKFKGEVSSVKAKCVPGRLVKVFLVEGADPNPSADTLIGKDTTNNNGRYRVVPAGGVASPGDFYARVKQRNIGRPGHKHICEADNSPEVTNPA